ncbi:MAG: RNA polymerase sigma factor [Pseudomonadota bacterium]
MALPSSRLRPALASPALDPAHRLDLGTLYGEHADTVARWVTRLAGPDLDVEDIVHEVFLVACRRLDEFRGDAKITTWLYEIAVRIVQDRRRSRRRRQWLFNRVSFPNQGSELEPAPVAAEQPNALALPVKKEASATLYEILDGLPEKYRTTVILFELEGLTGQEIAAVTKTSVANVWIRLHRARQRFLKTFLEREAREAR